MLLLNLGCGLLATAAVGSMACTGAGPQALPLAVSFSVSRGGKSVSCGAVPEIRRVTVTIFSADGMTILPGFPQDADCATGRFNASLPRANYVLAITATGTVADVPATLFAARQDVPAGARSVEVLLEPEAAYLAVGWSFGDQLLAPCIAVDHVVITVARTAQGGGGRGPVVFTATAACSATPLVIERPFAAETFDIEVDALSAGGLALFSGTVTRTAARGEQVFDLILAPLGGALELDFNFAIGSQMVRACDDPRVGVVAVQATVTPADGGATVRETFACAEPRPYAFRSARYLPGRRLTLELVAAGAQHFEARDAFTMPAGDKRWSPPITLYAVGTATVTVAVTTATCTHSRPTFHVRVAADDPLLPAAVPLDQLLPPGVTSVGLDRLPFGAYAVDVTDPATGCGAHALRTVAARWNAWPPVAL